jgi:CheY-like chemotaxis protein
MQNTPPPLHILLAEDDTDDRFFFTKAVNEIAIDTHLTTVADGEQLMNYLEEHVKNLPDILFLDLSMPRKSGFECLAEIKENDQLKDLQVVVVSTSFPRDKNYEQRIVNILLDIGANEFIRKPGDFEQLKALINGSLLRFIELKNEKPSNK